MPINSSALVTLVRWTRLYARIQLIVFIVYARIIFHSSTHPSKQTHAHKYCTLHRTEHFRARTQHPTAIACHPCSTVVICAHKAPLCPPTAAAESHLSVAPSVLRARCPLSLSLYSTKIPITNILACSTFALLFPQFPPYRQTHSRTHIARSVFTIQFYFQC